MSVSKVQCALSVVGRKETAEVSLFRHLAPMTVSAVVRGLPINGRVAVYQRAMVCVLTTLRLGVEKQRFQFSRGDVAFLPATGSVCFFLSGAKSDRPLNPLGRIEKGIEVIESAKAGDVLELRMVGGSLAATEG